MAFNDGWLASSGFHSLISGTRCSIDSTVGMLTVDGKPLPGNMFDDGMISGAAPLPPVTIGDGDTSLPATGRTVADVTGLIEVGGAGAGATVG